MGTILPYVGDLSDIPHGWALCDGTNGTPNLTGRFLQGWGWDDFYNRNVGEYVQEGLPNIVGKYAGGMEHAFTYLSEGALYFNNNNNPGNRGTAGVDYDNAGISLDASRCSWLYGNSSTVQPRAYIVYYIMRIS